MDRRDRGDMVCIHIENFSGIKAIDVFMMVSRRGFGCKIFTLIRRLEPEWNQHCSRPCDIHWLVLANQRDRVDPVAFAMLVPFQ